MTDTKETITVRTTVKETVENVWKIWTTTVHIMKWNKPSDEWHNLIVEADVKDDGLFLFRMQTKDGSDGFDYCGKYDRVKTNELIELTTSDGRKTINTFTTNGDETTVTETFEAESKTPIDIQKDFCQKVLNNFKKYVENEIK